MTAVVNSWRGVCRYCGSETTLRQVTAGEIPRLRVVTVTFCPSCDRPREVPRPWAENRSR